MSYSSLSLIDVPIGPPPVSEETEDSNSKNTKGAADIHFIEI